MTYYIEVTASSLIKPENQNYYDHEAKPQEVKQQHLTIKEKGLVVLTDTLNLKCVSLNIKDSLSKTITEQLFEIHPH